MIQPIWMWLSVLAVAFSIGYVVLMAPKKKGSSIKPKRAADKPKDKATGSKGKRKPDEVEVEEGDPSESLIDTMPYSCQVFFF